MDTSTAQAESSLRQGETAVHLSGEPAMTGRLGGQACLSPIWLQPALAEAHPCPPTSCHNMWRPATPVPPGV